MTTQSQIHCLPKQSVVSKGIFKRASLAYAAWRQRRVLARLDDAALNDIGITYAQAQAEAAKPVWDVPAHWRH